MNENKPKSKPGPKPRHGGYSLMTRADVLERRPRIRAYLGAVREGLIKDLGPREQDLTTAELALINHTISKLGVLRLIEEHILEQGVFTAEGLLDPALGKFWLAASNSLRLDLTALGIHTRKGEEALSLEKYIDMKAGEQPAPEDDPEHEQGADPEIVDPGATSGEIPDEDNAGDDDKQTTQGDEHDPD